MYLLPLAGFFPVIVSVSLVLGVMFPAQKIEQAGWYDSSHKVDSPQALEELFAEYDYQWPPQDKVPLLMLGALPEGLGAIDVKLKKSLFFRALLPIVLSGNKVILQQRQLLIATFAKGDIEAGSDVEKTLSEISANYRVDGKINNPEIRELLLRRVDEVPIAIVLAQAANESGWGTSRFTREANNLFGEWTYRSGEGLKPLKREDGENHSVRVFPDLTGSVISYLHNINIGHAYETLRQLRAIMRERQEPLDALALSAGLIRYSERGQAYVDEIRRMIRVNRLQQLVDLRLVN